MGLHAIVLVLWFAAPAAGRANDAEIVRVTAHLQPVVARAGEPVLRQTLAARMKHHHVPGVSVAVVNDGRLAWARGFGEKVAGGGSPVTPTTLFQAASISKPVTATALLRLVESGVLALDSDVNVYFQPSSWRVPENQHTATEKVTLRRILSHTAGLTVPSFDGYGPEAALPTLREVLEGLRAPNTEAVRVEQPPGSVCRYSGGGYTVAQLLLEQATKEDFASSMKRLVLDPLAMAHSTFQQPLPPALANDVAAAHLANGAPMPGGSLRYPQLAAAGLWSTPTDLLQWAAAIAAAHAAQPSALLTPRIAADMLTVQKGSLIGLGVFVKGAGRTLQFGHQGWNRGFHARVVYFPATGQGAAVMANGPGGRTLVNEVLAAIADAYRWPVRPARQTIAARAASKTLLARLPGHYAGGKPIEVVARIRRQGRTLFLDAPELGPETPVVVTAPDELTALDTGDRFEVRRSASGEVTALAWGDIILTWRPPR